MYDSHTLKFLPSFAVAVTVIAKAPTSVIIINFFIRFPYVFMSNHSQVYIIYNLLL